MIEMRLQYVKAANNGLYVLIREGDETEKDLVVTWHNDLGEVVCTEQCEYRHLFGVLRSKQDWKTS